MSLIIHAGRKLLLENSALFQCYGKFLCYCNGNVTTLVMENEIYILANYIKSDIVQFQRWDLTCEILEIMSQNVFFIQRRSAVHILVQQLCDIFLCILYHRLFLRFISSNNDRRALANRVLTDVVSMPNSWAISS